MAAINKGIRTKDEIWHHSSSDKNTKSTRIGTLERLKSINLDPTAENNIDAALCKPDDVSMIRPGLRRLGNLSGYVAAPTLRLRVSKDGAATGVTRGVIRQKNVSTIITYDTGDEAYFVGQLGIVGINNGGHFAAQGDSGAIVIDENNSPVGLLFAVCEGIDLAYANPIEPVFKDLGVRLPRERS